MTENPETLGRFLLSEMHKRDMSAREFARFIGADASIVSKFLNHGITDEYAGKPVGDPSIDFLDKLAAATNTDITFLVALVRPGATRRDITVMRLAERIAQLPPDKREIIEGYITAAVQEVVNESS